MRLERTLGRVTRSPSKGTLAAQDAGEIGGLSTDESYRSSEDKASLATSHFILPCGLPGKLTYNRHRFEMRVTGSDPDPSRSSPRHRSFQAVPCTLG